MLAAVHVSFSPPGARGWLLAVGVLLVVVLLGARRERGTDFALVLAARLALPVTAAVLALWMPRLRIDDHGATVRGVLRTVRVPWNRLQDVSTGWFLQLTAGGRTYRVAAVPAVSSIYATRDVHLSAGGVLERDIVGRLDRYDRTGGSPVGGLVAQRWAARADSATGEVVHRRNVPAVGALGLSALVTLAGLALGGPLPAP
jgi:hypothetical protein